MKPIIKTEQQQTDAILTKDITTQHIVVAIIANKPCILNKGFYEKGEKYCFKDLEDEGTMGNGFDFSNTENNIQLMVEYAIKGMSANVAVFSESDWKSALQWLIDNCA